MDLEKLDHLLESCMKSFRMNDEESEWFGNKKIARLIAAIPFLADCGQPERTALNHLGSYLFSIRPASKKYFDCTEDDHTGGNIIQRLETINTFIGGDKNIIKKGMALLSLCMISDYKRDMQADKQAGKFNPLNSGSIDYEKAESQLTGTINEIRNSEMDSIMSIDDALAVWWRVD